MENISCLPLKGKSRIIRTAKCDADLAVNLTELLLKAKQPVFQSLVGNAIWTQITPYRKFNLEKCIHLLCYGGFPALQ